MQPNDNEFFFDKCVYATVDEKIIDAAERDDDGIGRFTDETRWVTVADALTEAKKDDRVLTILFADKTNSLTIRWVAIVEDIELVEECTNITVGFVEELETPLPVAMLPIFGREHVLGDGLKGTYAICETPEFINDYLEWVLGAEDSVDEFKQALSVAKVTAKQREMLVHHYMAADHIITMKTMARLMDYSNANAANLQYGNFADRLAAILNHPIEPYLESLISIATPVDERDEDGQLHWKMRQELVYALEELGWVAVKTLLH